MASKEDLVTSLIKEHHQSLSEPTETTIAVIQDAADSIENKGDNGNENSNETGQEYVYWARRGELETAGEVEVSSSAIEYQEVVSGENTAQLLIVDENDIRNNAADMSTTTTAMTTSQRSTADLVYGLQAAAEQINAVNALQNGVSEEFLEQQRRLEAKREASKLQEKLMNEEYQKAIGYLLCSSKSKSGKQKKKQTMTAYLFFCRRYRAKIVSRNPKLSFAQISKLLSHMWRNASEQEKNTYRLKLEQHRTKVNAIVEKNMIEKMKMVKQQKLMEEIQRRNDEEHDLIASSSAELHNHNQLDHQQATEIHEASEEVTTTTAVTADGEDVVNDFDDDDDDDDVQDEQIVSHAVIDPTTKAMLLEGEC